MVIKGISRKNVMLFIIEAVVAPPEGLKLFLKVQI